MWLQNLTQRPRSNVVSNTLDNKSFQNFTQMSSDDFEFLIDVIELKIERKDIRFRQQKFG